MEQAPSAEKPAVVDPKWIWLKTRGAIVVSMMSAFVAAVGFDVKPRELIRPILMSAGFVEISVANQDTEVLINRIQDIAEKVPEHALIKQLRKLSKEAAPPFDGREKDIQLRLSEEAGSGTVGVVCRNSELRDTYLQFLSPNHTMVVLKVKDGACTQGEVQVNPETWVLLDLDQRRTVQTLKMYVLLHRPAELI
jgi:hypothetical protein